MFSRSQLLQICLSACIFLIQAEENNGSHKAANESARRLARRSVKLGNANEDFDGSISFIKAMFREKEPMVTGPRGDIDYCNVTGLSSVFRSGDITVQKFKENSNMLQLNMGFEQIDMSCHHNAKFFVYTVGGGTLTGVIRNVSLYAKAIIDYDSEESTRIQQFKITHPGTFDMSYNGKGIVAKIISCFLKKLKPLASNFMHRGVLDTIEVMVHYHKEHLSYIGGRDDDDDKK